jgi:hypothetical protein
MDNVTILLSESSCGMDVLEVLASGMTGFREGGGCLAKAYFMSWSSVGAMYLSVISQLSLSQSLTHLMSRLMEMTPCGPGIFRTK